jgi:predicted dehydrogenase
MIRVVRRQGVVFQMGTQTRSHGPVQDIIDLLHYGVIGNIQRVELNLPQYGGWTMEPSEEPPPELDYDRWLGPAPWRPYYRMGVHMNFRTVLDFSGGTITDHGVHRFDVAQWGTGHEMTSPVRIEGEALYPKDGIFDAPTIARMELTFADGITYFCETEPEVDKWGLTFRGDEGWIRVPMMAPLPHRPITASNPRLLKVKVPPSRRVAYRSENHWANFIECVKTRGRPAQMIEVGHRSTNCAHLSNIAMELGRPVTFDPEREIFPDDPEANAKLDRPKREPWARFFEV